MIAPTQSIASLAGPFDRAPAQVGAALIAFLLLLASTALRLAPSPMVPAVILHVSGVEQPGWYAGGTAGSALRAAGGDPRFVLGRPLDGDQVKVFGAYAVTALDAAPIAFRATGRKLHLNTASQLELESLPKVGPTLAARIRAGRPYRSVEDLDAVKGIGVATLRALRPFVEP